MSDTTDIAGAAAAVEGVRFNVGEHRFIMNNGVPDSLVVDYDGEEQRESQCVGIIGSRWAHHDDTNLIELHDGTFVLDFEADAVELHDGDYALAEDAVELHDGDYALVEDAVELHDGDYALVEDTIKTHTDETILREDAIPVFMCSEWTRSDGSEAEAAKAIAAGNQPRGDWHVFHRDDNEESSVVYSSDYGGELLVHEDYVVYNPDGEAILDGESVTISTGWDHEYYHRDDEYICCDVHGIYFHTEGDTHVYVGSAGDYYPVDETEYCDHCGEYRVEGSSCCDCDDSADRIHDWDYTAPCTLYRGSSPWLVGYEVEKSNVCGNSCRGSSVDENSLFAAWVTDSSCGVEGVTHAYDPCDADMIAKFKSHVEEESALRQLESDHSRSCGGHVNISHSSFSGSELMDRFREGPAALIYGLYRYRLGNSFCSDNRRLDDDFHAPKYSVARVRSNGVMEVRLFSAVRCPRTLLNRHKLMGEVCKAMERGDKGFLKTYRAVRETLLSAYGGNRDKLAKAIRAAHAFADWFKYGEASPCISRWVSDWGQRPRRVTPPVVDAEAPIWEGISSPTTTIYDTPDNWVNIGYGSASGDLIMQDWGCDSELMLRRGDDWIESSTSAGWTSAGWGGDNPSNEYAVLHGSPAHIIWSANRGGVLSNMRTPRHAAQVLSAMLERWQDSASRCVEMSRRLMHGWVSSRTSTLEDGVVIFLSDAVSNCVTTEDVSRVLGYIANVNGQA